MRPNKEGCKIQKVPRKPKGYKQLKFDETTLTGVFQKAGKLGLHQDIVRMYIQEDEHKLVLWVEEVQ